LSYEFQKKWLKVEHEGLLMGMPGWRGSWMGNTVEEQIDWVIADGKVGVAIWDAAMTNSKWKTASVWNRLKAVKEDLGPLSSTALSSGVLISSSSMMIDAVVEYEDLGLIVSGRQSSLETGEWKLLSLSGEVTASGDHFDLGSNLQVQESGIYFLRVLTANTSKVVRLVLK
jgi:hypothetical protein